MRTCLLKFGDTAMATRLCVHFVLASVVLPFVGSHTQSKAALHELHIHELAFQHTSSLFRDELAKSLDAGPEIALELARRTAGARAELLSTYTALEGSLLRTAAQRDPVQWTCTLTPAPTYSGAPRSLALPTWLAYWHALLSLPSLVAHGTQAQQEEQWSLPLAFLHQMLAIASSSHIVPPSLPLPPSHFKALAVGGLLAAELERRGVPHTAVAYWRRMDAEGVLGIGRGMLQQLQPVSAAQGGPGSPVEGSAGEGDSEGSGASSSSAETTPTPPPPVEVGAPEYPEFPPPSCSLPGWDYGLAMAGLLLHIPSPSQVPPSSPADAAQARAGYVQAVRDAPWPRFNLSALQAESAAWEERVLGLRGAALIEVADRVSRAPPPPLPPSQGEWEDLVASTGTIPRHVLTWARAAAIRRGFLHAWDGYASSPAWGQDVLQPHSRAGAKDHCDMGVTLIDAQDTALLMGLHTPYVQGLAWVRHSLAAGIGGQSFISLFECTIRVLGGLLSTADLVDGSEEVAAPTTPVWGVRAGEIARAFHEAGAWSSPTGLPYGTVSLANRSREEGSGEMLPVTLPATPPPLPQDAGEGVSTPTATESAQAASAQEKADGEGEGEGEGEEEEASPAPPSPTPSPLPTATEPPVVSHPSVPDPPVGAQGVKTVSGHAWNPGWAGGASSVSEVATLQVEHAALSARLNTSLYHGLATRAARALTSMGVADGLYTMYVDVSSGQLRDSTVTLGARGDSTYEYLLKQWLMAGGWRWERQRARALARAAVHVILPHWMDAHAPACLVQEAQGARREEQLVQAAQDLQAAVNAAMPYVTPSISKQDNPRWLLHAYNKAVAGVLDGLLQRSTPGNYTYIAEASKSRSALQGEERLKPLTLVHKMDHLVCFLPGVLGLGAAHGAGHEALAAWSERGMRVREIGQAIEEWREAVGLAEDWLESCAYPWSREASPHEEPHVEQDRPHLPPWLAASPRGRALVRLLLHATVERWTGPGELAHDVQVQIDELARQVQGSKQRQGEEDGGEQTAPVPSGAFDDLLDDQHEMHEEEDEDPLEAYLVPEVPPLTPSRPHEGPPFSSWREGTAITARLWEEAHGLAHTCARMWHSTSTGLAPEIVTFTPGADFAPNQDARHSLLRPETAESLYLLYALTGEERYREDGWSMWTAIEAHARVRAGGYASVQDAEHPSARRPAACPEGCGQEEGCAGWGGSAGTANQRDRQESFALAETFKYLYLLQLEPGGGYGPRADGSWAPPGPSTRCPRMQPMLPLVLDHSELHSPLCPWQRGSDGQSVNEEQWLFNTEAHPLRVPTSARPPSSFGKA